MVSKKNEENTVTLRERKRSYDACFFKPGFEPRESYNTCRMTEFSRLYVKPLRTSILFEKNIVFQVQAESSYFFLPILG